jgi:hypothetical protein
MECGIRAKLDLQQVRVALIFQVPLGPSVTHSTSSALVEDAQ